MSSQTVTDNNATQTIAHGRWRIDPARSSVEFRAPTLWGVATVKGHFDRYDGTLDLDREPAIELTIDADSLDTSNKLRDRHLRSPEFFGVEDHPEVLFVSDTAALEGERLKVRGHLYAAGHSIPLQLDASVRAVGDELEVDARTYADHRKLGMSHGFLGMVPTPSELIVHGRLVR